MGSTVFDSSSVYTTFSSLFSSSIIIQFSVYLIVLVSLRGDWLLPIDSRPLNTAALENWQKRRYWKTAVKGVIHNQEKHIRDLKISSGYWGGGGATVF